METAVQVLQEAQVAIQTTCQNFERMFACEALLKRFQTTFTAVQRARQAILTTAASLNITIRQLQNIHRICTKAIEDPETHHTWDNVRDLCDTEEVRQLLEAIL